MPIFERPAKRPASIISKADLLYFSVTYRVNAYLLTLITMRPRMPTFEDFAGQFGQLGKPCPVGRLVTQLILSGSCVDRRSHATITAFFRSMSRYRSRTELMPRSKNGSTVVSSLNDPAFPTHWHMPPNRPVSCQRMVQRVVRPRYRSHRPSALSSKRSPGRLSASSSRGHDRRRAQALSDTRACSSRPVEAATL